MSGELTTAQVADYLDIKVQTVYAYVSRGVLTPARKVPGLGSVFRLDDVQALMDGGRHGRRVRRPAASNDVRTTITQVGAGQLAYRGVEVTELVTTHDSEQVRHLLVGHPPGPLAVSSTDQAVLARLLQALPAPAAPLDLFKHAVLLGAATDPGRRDRSPAAIARAGHRSAVLMALCLPGATPAPEGEPRLLETLSSAFPGCPRHLLDLVLLLLADHDLAVSTTAVRVAVSSGADAYSAFLAGLAAADSPQHMAAPLQAHDWLPRALADPQEALDTALTGERPPPGFGHVVYTEQDPRAEVLLIALAEHLGPTTSAVLRWLEEELLRRRGWVLNVDLALAVLVHTFDLPRQTGPALFGCARMTGWTAHAIEELAEPGMRFRLRGVYTAVRGSAQ